MNINIINKNGHILKEYNAGYTSGLDIRSNKEKSITVT